MTSFVSKLLLLAILVSTTPLFSSDIQVTNVIFSGAPADSTSQTFVFLTVTWKNSWRNKSNHDAAWIFFKLRNQNDGRSYKPCPVKLTGHSLINNYERNDCLPSFFVPAHQAGVLVYPSSAIRGDVSWRIKVAVDSRLIRGIDFQNIVFASAYAIEMVKVPSGSFYAGDESEYLQKNASAFYEAGSKKRFLIKSEDEFQVGSEDGSLNYEIKDMPQYRGDVKGPVPDTFPKGFQEFYIMKYEVTMGQYTDFLNALSNQPSAFRANFGGKQYQSGRGGIAIENGVYTCRAVHSPANYISWDDGCAFADWAGLRPFTELEYEKAARGTVSAVASDFPWGTSSFGKIARHYSKDGELVFDHRLSEADLNQSQLDLVGASYFWVMDLSGSLWERVVTIGSEKGRSFKGTHGDGVLDQFGNATNDDWPDEQEGGFGYRGGGTYDFGMAFGPNYAEVGSRNFGAWGDGPRSVAYGFRAALTAQ